MRDEQKGIIPFESWNYLVDLLQTFGEHNRIVILKARQLGISTLVAGYALWHILFKEGATVYMLSQHEKAAFKLLAKARVMWQFLPDFLRLTLGKDSDGALSFPVMHSTMDALPSTEDAGRMTGATLVICDEWEYHPHAEKNFGALQPTLGHGGQFIGLSTADKTVTVEQSFFKQKYIGAKNGQGGFYPVFLSWRLRPGRDDAWLGRETSAMPDWQAEQEYPDNEEDALTTLKTRMFFDKDAIEYMYQDVQESIKHELVNKYHGMVRIFQLPVVGERYCIYTDPSDGKEDPHAIMVIKGSGEQVAESHGKVSADQCARIHDDLVRLYFDAFNTYELNARAGGIFSEKLKELDTPNQCPFLNAKTWELDDSGKTGWYTTNPLKDKMLWGLEEAVRLYQYRLHSKEGIDELKMFLIPEGDQPQAPKGGHDDYVMASGGVWLLKTYMPAESGKVQSYRYRRTW